MWTACWWATKRNSSTIASARYLSSSTAIRLSMDAVPSASP